MRPILNIFLVAGGLFGLEAAEVVVTVAEPDSESPGVILVLGDDESLPDRFVLRFPGAVPPWAETADALRQLRVEPVTGEPEAYAVSEDLGAVDLAPTTPRAQALPGDDPDLAGALHRILNPARDIDAEAQRRRIDELARTVIDELPPPLPSASAEVLGRAEATLLVIHGGELVPGPATWTEGEITILASDGRYAVADGLDLEPGTRIELHQRAGSADD